MPYTINREGDLQTDDTMLAEAPLRSEGVSEIVSHQPSFLIRYGTVIFLGVLLLIGIAGWLIRYPQIVSGKAVLTSLNAPKPVIAKTDGKLVMLSLHEGEEVKEGDVLGFLESTGRHTEVLELSQYLNRLDRLLVSGNEWELVKVKDTNFNQLGELQPSFQTFKQSFTEYSNYIADGFYVKKRALLATDKAYLQQQNRLLHSQKDLQQRDLALAEKTFAMNDTLMKQKVISPLEYRNEQSKYLQKQSAVPQLNASILSNENGQNDKDKEISELESTTLQQKALFMQALHTLQSEVDDWVKKYVITAPATGKVSVTNFLEVNQPVSAGQTLCYISSGNTSYYAQITIPQANFGKVKEGEEVMLKFEAYPKAQWGSVWGNINFISRVPTDSGYVAKISLPNGLATDYHKTIQYHDGLIATGDIITEDRRLLEQLYQNLYSQIRQ